MSSNKRAKEELIRCYGPECFIDKLKLRDNTNGRRYTGKSHKSRMKQLTYHHIKMKKDGGRATRENGALLSAENHQWFNQQSKEAQEYMNRKFQEYKAQVDGRQPIVIDTSDLPIETIEPQPIVEEPKEKYNRAKEKREVQKIINDYFNSQK